MIRFSQRELVDDQRDLRPEVANFGTAEEIRIFMRLTQCWPAIRKPSKKQ